MDIPIDYHEWSVMLEHYQTHAKAGQHHRAKKLFCRRYRMICITSSKTGQMYHFATDFNCVLLQLVGTDIVNTLSKYRVSYKHQPFMFETFELLKKSYEKFDTLFMNIQCSTAWLLKKVNFSKKCCVKTRIQRMKVWYESLLPWLKYNIFSTGLFFIGAPCTQ